tara:strand:+ start:12661 stop:13002 length:342 start_codon:yes stop_codon:yes gene_type:complete
MEHELTIRDEDGNVKLQAVATNWLPGDEFGAGRGACHPKIALNMHIREFPKWQMVYYMTMMKSSGHLGDVALPGHSDVGTATLFCDKADADEVFNEIDRVATADPYGATDSLS